MSTLRQGFFDSVRSFSGFIAMRWLNKVIVSIHTHTTHQLRSDGWDRYA
jgi:hypothetical protein